MYKKPKGLLLAKPVKRIAPKSQFLKNLEKQQRFAEDVAHVHPEVKKVERVLTLVDGYKERRS